MALQYSTAVRNAELDALEAAIGTAPLLRTGRVIELGYASTAAICGNTTGPARECPVWVMRVGEE